MKKIYSFMLRFKGKSPKDMPLEDLVECIRLFALLLGKENHSTFHKIVAKSTGVQANTPPERKPFVYDRLRQGESGPAGSAFKQISSFLLEKRMPSAELSDSSGQVIHRFESEAANDNNVIRVKQRGHIDGIVVGLRGADDTMQLYLRDTLGRDYNITVKDDDLARQLLQHFKAGVIRVELNGSWLRDENGWHPEHKKCIAESFAPLSDQSLNSLFSELRSLAGNGWHSLSDPISEWREIRGIIN